MPNHVLQLDCTSGNGDVEVDFGSGQPEIWVEFDVAFNSTFLSSLVGQMAFWLGHNAYGFIGLYSGVLKWRCGAAAAFTPSSPITALQFYHVKLHLDGAFASGPLTEMWIDGTLIGTDTGTLIYNDTRFFDLEEGVSEPGGFLYYDNFKAGTTDGGTELGTDDFEGGSLAFWNGGVADAAIIVDPGIAPPSGGGPTPPTADFTGTPTIGASPLSVAFTDSSTPGSSGPITSWSWTFGDGGTSSTQNPTHIYTVAGTYTVVLVVTGTSPDGPDTKTRTNYITVGTAPANASQDNATNLTPFCSTATVSNQFAPTTPAIDDPLSIFYGDTFSRQVWFKLTNTSGRQAYARFTITQPPATASDIAGGIFLGHPASDLTPYERSFGGDQQTFIATPLTGGSTEVLGTALEPGQTVWLELAGYDVPGSGWDGNMGLEWQLLTATFYDTPDEFTGAAEYRGTPQSGAVVSPDAKSYCKAGNLHFAAVYDNGVSSTYGDLSVWVWTDGGGAATVYTVGNVQLQTSGIGFGFGSGIPILRTDGSNVWLVTYTQNTAAECFGNTFSARQVNVFIWNGGGFTLLGTDLNSTHPVHGSTGGWTQSVGQLAAAASSAEPGVLHVVWCEAGPDTCTLNADSHANHMHSRVSYSKWNTGGLIVQNDTIVSDQTTPSGSTPDVSTTAITQWMNITNAYGSPMLFHGPCTSYDPLDAGGPGTITYGNALNMYSIDGSGNSTLLQSFNGATDGSTTHTGYLLESGALSVTMGLSMKQPQKQLSGQNVILINAVWGSGGGGSGYKPTLSVHSDGSSAITELVLAQEGGEWREAIVDDTNIWYGAGAVSAFVNFKISGRSLTCVGETTTYFGPFSSGTAPLISQRSQEFFWDEGLDCFFVLGRDVSVTQLAPLRIPILRNWLVCGVGDCEVASGVHIAQRF